MYIWNLTIHGTIQPSGLHWNLSKRNQLVSNFRLKQHAGILPWEGGGCKSTICVIFRYDTYGYLETAGYPCWYHGEDLVRRKESVEQLNLRQLNRFIETLHMRGDANIKFALIQKNSRLAVPFSSFILTIMGVALSSRKRRGGIGLNIGIGIALSFSYILFLRFSEMFVHADVMSPGSHYGFLIYYMLFVAFVLYRLAPK